MYESIRVHKLQIFLGNGGVRNLIVHIRRINQWSSVTAHGACVRNGRAGGGEDPCVLEGRQQQKRFALSKYTSRERLPLFECLLSLSLAAQLSGKPHEESGHTVAIAVIH